MKLINKSFLFVLLMSVSMGLHAHVGPKNGNKKNNVEKDKTNLREDCQPGIAERDMDINNVRARLSTGGDVWWNRDEGLYIVPKPAEGELPVSSIFAGGVWVGGTTRAGNLKLAGVTYRSLTSNFDWYPGPLDEMGATDAPICKNWDQFFIVEAIDAKKAVRDWEELRENYSVDSIPDAVKYWPGQGNPYWREKYDFDLPDQPLGAFYDELGDGVYDPLTGDFPTIQIEGCDEENKDKARKKAIELIPDQMYFWVYNDNGGPHRLTAGDAIQMEVQVQAFAYATNDEINDMTFQRYRLLNKADEDLIDCYFAMWVDPDLGCPFDDFSGCDNTLDASGKPRSLAYTYNEDDVDGNNGPNCGAINTYQFNVPIVGTDYFRGPRGPRVFKRDIDGNIVKDTLGNVILEEPEEGTGLVDTLVELGMTSCVFTFNCSSNPPDPATCDPETQDVQFYNNMRGLWRTGVPITFGGSGYDPSSMDSVRYMYSDAPDDPNGWSMCNTGVSNVDTRTLQATGPLLLQKGALNELIVGVVWVPDIDYPCPSLDRIRSADDVAQALFDNCFDITDGPAAPDMCGIELDRELILTLSNSKKFNNFNEEYEEPDQGFSGEPGDDDTYNFEGYKIYQLANAGVTGQELDNIEKARLVYQTDIKNGVAECFNWTSSLNPFDPTDRIWSFTREVDGADEGLSRTFQVLEDQFSPTSDRRLINHKTYHFMVLSYGYNNWRNFNSESEIGQRRTYIEGRDNVQVYSLTPRPIIYENLNAKYADGAAITRISGQGNNGNFLDLKEGEAERMLSADYDGTIKYEEGAGPFEVKVFNPFEIKNKKYRLEIIGEFNDASKVCALEDGATWILIETVSNDTIASKRTLEEVNEQIIEREGFSIEIANGEEPGAMTTSANGSVGQSIVTEDVINPWYVPVQSGGGPLQEAVFQAFVAGVNGGNQPQFDPNNVLTIYENGLLEDPDKEYERLGVGAFVPYYGARVVTLDGANADVPPYISPGAREGNTLIFARNTGNIGLEMLNNVDIVFTSDKDLWSRCIVVESANPYHYDVLGSETENGTKQFDLMPKESIGKDGKPDGSGTEGFSWFPGYAVDVETGQRLNIFFGENTIYNMNPGSDSLAQYLNDGTENIATDMIFNPTPQLLGDAENQAEFANIVLGGHHMVFVTRTVYDGCEDLAKEYGKTSKDFKKVNAITWAGIAMGSVASPMLSIEDGLVPADLSIKLRVSNRFGNEIAITDLSDINKCNALEEPAVYEFEFVGKEAVDLTEEEYEGALENVNVVPNPYYAYSSYENTELVNRIKVTNLPDRAIVNIYTLDGKFIRGYDRSESRMIKTDATNTIGFSQTNPSLEWDLKNSKGIPVSSGVYLFHIIAPDLGEERVIKWFGVNRQFDPTGL